MSEATMNKETGAAMSEAKMTADEAMLKVRAVYLGAYEGIECIWNPLPDRNVECLGDNWIDAASKVPTPIPTPASEAEKVKAANGCEGCGEPVYLTRGFGYSHCDTTLNVGCDARPKPTHPSVPKETFSSVRPAQGWPAEPTKRNTLDVERAEKWLDTDHPEFSNSRQLAEVMHDYSLSCLPTPPSTEESGEPEKTCVGECTCGGCPHFNPYDPWNRRGEHKPASQNPPDYLRGKLDGFNEGVEAVAVSFEGSVLNPWASDRARQLKRGNS